MSDIEKEIRVFIGEEMGWQFYSLGCDENQPDFHQRKLDAIECWVDPRLGWPHTRTLPDYTRNLDEINDVLKTKLNAEGFSGRHYISELKKIFEEEVGRAATEFELVTASALMRAKAFYRMAKGE